MNLDTALRVAMIVAVIFVFTGIASAVLIRKLIGKLVSIVVFGGLALVVWTQRSNISDCAAKATVGDTTCTFLWFDVAVPSPVDDLPGR